MTPYSMYNNAMIIVFMYFVSLVESPSTCCAVCIKISKINLLIWKQQKNGLFCLKIELWTFAVWLVSTKNASYTTKLLKTDIWTCQSYLLQYCKKGKEMHHLLENALEGIKSTWYFALKFNALNDMKILKSLV